MVRPFVLADLAEAHRVLSDAWTVPRAAQPAQLPAWERWLRWVIANKAALAESHQPPLGDRAVVRKANGRLIGSVGLVPALAPSASSRDFRTTRARAPGSWSWGSSGPSTRRTRGTVTPRALIERTVAQFHLGRVVALAEVANGRSQVVMRKLGMQIERNAEPELPWFQAVAVLTAPGGPTPE